MGGGIMNIVPRDKALLGGLKKAVKKVTKGVKDIVSSDIGKAALLYAGTAGLGALGAGAARATTGFGGIFNPSNVMSNLGASFINFKSTPFGEKIFGKAIGDTDLKRSGGILENLFSVATGKGTDKGSGFLTKGLALAGLSTFLTSKFGMSEEQAEEVIANPESRALYLRRYYENLNPNAQPEEIEEFVAANVAEYAVGGRVGFAEGDPLPPDPTQPVNPFKPKPIGPVLPNKMMASNIENDKILEALFEKYLDMGLSPKEAEKAARDEFERMSMKPIQETRGVAALGGRMGFDKGTPMGLAGLGSLMDEEMVVIITQDEDGNPKLIQVPRSEVMKDMKMPIVVDDKMDSGDIVIPMDKEKILEGIVPRDNKANADTASENAMQAAGIEGLPLRQNPKGVKELDLRETGGFIQPVGIKEKEDDIPAMLSNNEFVFTADAVRGMGDGNVNLGAQRMYDMMKKLEAGGRV